MAENDKKTVILNNAEKSKRKTVVISLLAFLVTGGGIFLYFIIQGANDLTGPGNANFHYGSVVRDSVQPFFKYIGVIGEDEEALAKAAEDRMKSRGVLPEEKAVDLGDWDKKDASAAAPAATASAGYSGSGGRSGSSGAPTAVPRMNGGGGRGIQSGGGSSTSGSVSRFASGGASGGTRISANGAVGAGLTGKDKGTLGALRNAQAMLGDGLRSGSAMTAHTKWDKSFGVNTTGGGRGGNLSYGKQGLVDLDTIKSGEISSLKTTGTGSIPSATPPSLDAAATAAKAASDAASGKSAADIAGDAAKQGLEKGLNSATQGGGGPKSDSGGDGAGGTQPPDNIKQLAEKQSSSGGSWCPHGCTTPEGCTGSECSTYIDNPPQYEKTNKDGWVIVYSGRQMDSTGSVTYYMDRCTVDPKTNEITGMGSFEGSNPSSMSFARKF